MFDVQLPAIRGAAPDLACDNSNYAGTAVSRLVPQRQTKPLDDPETATIDNKSASEPE
jgi:hypothetical protein